MIPCAQCGRMLGEDGSGPAASISGSIMGDESTESYYLCNECGAYTVRIYDDRFCGEDRVSVRGPLSRAEGDVQVALIGRCSRPWDKKCRCDAHREYFRGWLD